MKLIPRIPGQCSCHYDSSPEMGGVYDETSGYYISLDPRCAIHSNDTVYEQAVRLGRIIEIVDKDQS